MRHPNSDATPEGLDVSTDRRGVLGAGLALAAGTLLGTAREGRAADAPPSPPAMPAAADATPVDLKLLPGFKVERVKTSGAELHTVVGGSGPPLLLIHGAPLTHLSWFRVAPELAKKYTVIAADLRGYGDSSKPADGDKHINYSKRAMATDQVELMKHFGFSRFAVVGHDRGGRVAHRLALDHPEAVSRMSVLDIVPTQYLYAHVTRAFVEAYFHWFLYLRPAPYPEDILNREVQSGAFSRGGLPELRDEYARVYRNPAAIHGMCEDYRASAGIDIEYDEADIKAGKKVTCPLHVLWASDGAMGRMYDVLGIWKDHGTQVTGAPLTGGHNLQEANPAGVLAQLQPFLAG
ncbi:MAG TPA: alpha/beta hydrolase [Steroidobacteraceae bacterium]|nr:alpha/beta hydrolase [Steroidobacteraceae bacterium]